MNAQVRPYAVKTLEIAILVLAVGLVGFAARTALANGPVCPEQCDNGTNCPTAGSKCGASSDGICVCEQDSAGICSCFEEDPPCDETDVEPC